MMAENKPGLKEAKRDPVQKKLQDLQAQNNRLQEEVKKLRTENVRLKRGDA
jgi:predicted nuclease with TOPRIM domain